MAIFDAIEGVLGIFELLAQPKGGWLYSSSFIDNDPSGYRLVR